MKKLLLSVCIVSISIPMLANLNGSGYYRVKNFGSNRWAALVDNQGSADLVAGTADLHSLALTSDTEMILSDPASVVYISNIEGKEYNIAAQGTSLKALSNQPIYIGSSGTAPDGQTLYRLWGTYQNVTKYIADGNLITSDVEGYATIKDLSDNNFKNWYLLPIEVTSNNYFGTTPSINIDGNLYTTLFTSFAYQPYSDGVKAYYISRVGFGMAEMVEINGAVPTGAPVVIQCAGENVADNKLQILETQEALPDNALSGVYFAYDSEFRKNYVAYDPSIMRVLGQCEDGSLGFITASGLAYIPANTAYLRVPPGSAREFKCVTSTEFEANIPEAPDQIYFTEELTLQPIDDYTYTGQFDVPAPENGNDLIIKFYTSSDFSDENSIGAALAFGQDVTLNMATAVSLPFSYGSPYTWVIPDWKGGDLNFTINIQYEYMSAYSESAGVDGITVSGNKLAYNGREILSTEAQAIKVVDMAGRTVAQGYGTRLDISTLPSGVYVAVSNGSQLKIAK